MVVTCIQQVLESTSLALHAWQPCTALTSADVLQEPFATHLLSLHLCTAHLPQPWGRSFKGQPQSQQWPALLHAAHYMLCTLQICITCHHESLDCSCAVSIQAFTFNKPPAPPHFSSCAADLHCLPPWSFTWPWSAPREDQLLSSVTPLGHHRLPGSQSLHSPPARQSPESADHDLPRKDTFKK